MFYYDYDSKTKEFLSKKIAREDPLETKVQGRPIYILPAHATFVECPAKQSGFAWCFDEQKQKWYKMLDSRGEKVYLIADGSEVTVTELGIIPFKCTSKKPEVEFPLWNGTDWEEDSQKRNAFEKEKAVQRLSETDSSMARAAEDLISVLVDKGVIASSDLPTALLTKIQSRQALREEIAKY